MTKKLVVLLAAIACLALPSAAEVLDSAANGFTIKVMMNVNAAPKEVYRHLLNVGQWWDPSHTYSGNSRNLTLDTAKGRWCETLPDQGIVRHMQVVMAKPGEALRLTGMLGPLQALGGDGSMSIQLTPSEGGTKVEITYAVGGYLSAGLNTFAAPVDSVVTEQFNRLKNYIETGSPTGKK